MGHNHTARQEAHIYAYAQSTPANPSCNGKTQNDGAHPPTLQGQRAPSRHTSNIAEHIIVCKKSRQHFVVLPSVLRRTMFQASHHPCQSTPHSVPTDCTPDAKGLREACTNNKTKRDQQPQQRPAREANPSSVQAGRFQQSQEMILLQAKPHT